MSSIDRSGLGHSSLVSLVPFQKTYGPHGSDLKILGVDMKKRAVVIGAGASGLASARLAARRGAEVTVIESAPGPGGAWMPFEATVDGEALAFDRGIRLGMATGDADIDHEIYECLDFDWYRIDGFPREGHVLRGLLWDKNQCPDARRLGEEAAARARREVEAGVDEPEASNLEEWMLGRFGRTLVEGVYEPFLRKVFGRELTALAPKADRFFVPGRVVLDDDEATDAMREAHPNMCGRVAHPSTRSLSVPGRAFLHPEGGPMGRWITGACEDLEKMGADLRFGAKVVGLEHDGGRVSAVVLDDGERVECDVLFWSRPPSALLRAAAIPAPSVKPEFRDLAVIHLVATGEPSTDLHYATFFDPDDIIHRAFFYREVRPGCGETERRSMSVEVVLEPGEEVDEASLTRRVLAELKCARLMPAAAKVHWSHTERFSRVFPVPTPEFSAADRACRARVAELENVGLVGRSEDTAFLDAILVNCDRQVGRLLGARRVRTAA